MKKHGQRFRCDVCGKFIAYKDIPLNVVSKFTPETEITTEETLFTHRKCLKNLWVDKTYNITDLIMGTK